MAQLKVGDRVKLNIKEPFGDYVRQEAVITGRVDGAYSINGVGVFVQGGGDLIPNGFRDRFYAMPFEPEQPYFTRT